RFFVENRQSRLCRLQGRHSGLTRMPERSREKRDCENRGRSESGLPCSAAISIASEFPTKSRPDLLGVGVVALRDGHLIDECQNTADRVVLRTADVARTEMFGDRRGRFVVVIVVKYEFLFCQMLHAEDLTNGS